MDKFSPEVRSRIMRGIKGVNTSLELKVRRICREIGYKGYRIHVKSVIGKPDIAWIGLKKAIFINGCFWHAHNCGKGRHIPKSNQEFWIKKLNRNRLRDAKNVRALRALGWKVMVIWECELKNPERVSGRVHSLMK